jgi:hypothetical protein
MFSWISVISAICYLYICVFKYFSDMCGLLANVGKCSPFWGEGGSICEYFVLFCLGFGNFHGWIGKEL